MQSSDAYPDVDAPVELERSRERSRRPIGGHASLVASGARPVWARGKACCWVEIARVDGHQPDYLEGRGVSTRKVRATARRWQRQRKLRDV